MKQARLHRLFGPDGKCFDVAIDHGFFNEAPFLSGIESMADAVGTVVEAAPDAVQLTVGQARHLQSIPGKTKPSLVLRTDVANVYGKELPRTLYSRVIKDAALQAVQLDAACVCVNLFAVPGEPEVGEQCVSNILEMKPTCDHYGMPMMVEPLVFRPNAEAGGYMVDGHPDKIIPLVRQAIELGADIIKADPTDDISQYHRVVETCGGTPILVRGGSKATDEVILDRTEALMGQGVAGIVYGRNVIQHESPAGITKALMAIVHEGATAKDAIAALQAL
ncbi:MAG: aldolase [Verrucomicrobiaceae bacterium]|nr:aldolase [Verrucomicrobiaceae bacterium]